MGLRQPRIIMTLTKELASNTYHVRQLAKQTRKLKVRSVPWVWRLAGPYSVRCIGQCRFSVQPGIPPLRAHLAGPSHKRPQPFFATNWLHHAFLLLH